MSAASKVTEGTNRSKVMLQKNTLHDPSPEPLLSLADHAFGGFDDRNDGLSFTSKKSFQKKPHPSPTRRICLGFSIRSSIGDASAVSWIRTELSPKNVNSRHFVKTNRHCNPNKNSGGSNNLDLWLSFCHLRQGKKSPPTTKRKQESSTHGSAKKSPDTIPRPKTRTTAKTNTAKNGSG